MLAVWPRLLVLVGFFVFGGIEAARADSAPNPDAATLKWEAFADFYGGYAMTNGGDVDAETTFWPLFGGPTHGSGTRQVSYDPSFVVGGRVGVFYDFVGLALDASYFRADDDNVKNSVLTLSPLLMFRLQLLTSKDNPNGRMQPYVGIGPAFLGIYQSLDFRPDIADKLDVWSSGIGFDARAGLRWFFGSNVGLFAEYRFVRAKFRYKDKSSFLGTTETKVSGTLTSQHILGGITVYF